MATINLGRVGFVQKGTYSGATAYKINDVVVYNNGVYACISPTTGNLPTNTSYWKLWLDPSTLVAKTGDETITGVKTFSSNTIFNGNVGIGENNTGIYGKLLIHGSGYVASAAKSAEGAVCIIAANANNDVRIGSISNHTLNIMANSEIKARVSNDGFLVTTPIGLGYGTGAGGTVTQLTSKSTTVTLNKPCGRIMMHNESLAAGATVSFQLGCNILTISDNLLITLETTNLTNTGAYNIWWNISNGGCYVNIKNISGISLSEALVLNFTVFKGANL